MRYCQGPQQVEAVAHAQVSCRRQAEAWERWPGQDALLQLSAHQFSTTPSTENVTARCSTHQDGPQLYFVWGVVCPASGCRVLAVAQAPACGPPVAVNVTGSSERAEVAEAWLSVLSSHITNVSSYGFINLSTKLSSCSHSLRPLR